MSHPSSGNDEAIATSPQELKTESAIPSPIITSGSIQKQGASMEPSRAAMRCRIALAVTGISLGVLVFLVFLAVEKFRNYHISLWGLASGVFAVFTLIVHLQHLRGDHDLWLNRLKVPIILGFTVQLGTIAAFITYIVLAITEKQDLMPLNGLHHGYYVAAVWVFMMWKWSFALFWYSKSYRKFYMSKYVAILP